MVGRSGLDPVVARFDESDVAEAGSVEDLFELWATDDGPRAVLMREIGRRLDTKSDETLAWFLENDQHVRGGAGYWLREAIRKRLRTQSVDWSQLALEDLFQLWAQGRAPEWGVEHVPREEVKRHIRRKLDQKVAAGGTDELRSWMDNDPNVQHPRRGQWIREQILERLPSGGDFPSGGASALLEAGRQRLSALRREAEQLMGIMGEAQRLMSASSRGLSREREALVILLLVVAGRAKEDAASALGGAEGSTAVLVAGHDAERIDEIESATHVLRRIRQLSEGLEQRGSTEDRGEEALDYAMRVRILLGRLQDETGYTDGLEAEVEAAETFLADWAEYTDEKENVPWYMWVPVVNIAGLAFWDPSRRGFQDTGSALIFGPIVIAVTGAVQLYLEPENIVEITRGKVEVIRDIADDELTDAQRWEILLEYSAKRTVDIAAALAGRKLPALRGSPARMGWQAWARQNADGLTSRLVLEALKSLATESADQITDLTGENRPPEEALEKVSRDVLKKALSEILLANTSASDAEDPAVVNELLEILVPNLVKQGERELDSAVARE